MPPSSPELSDNQLEDLQSFLKDWLRHRGRTQSDLRRALRASSIRMPVLIEELQHTYRERGLAALAERLCGIEEIWRGEDQAPHPGTTAADAADSLSQLDLLLREIRDEQQP
jgi:hypothetical protein